ncbi:MAG: response regulator transcription factor [Bacteroidota bacterium]
MKILIADDHSIVRVAIRNILEEAYPTVQVEEVSGAAGLIEKVRQQNWDVIISDIDMPPGNSGLAAMKQIKILSPHTPVLFLSMYGAESYALKAIEAGAAGYLSKDMASMELVKAVSHILSGKKYVNEEVAAILVNSVDGSHLARSVDKLSPRELEVFISLAQGKTIADISMDLELSGNTISTFRTRIFEKMKFQSTIELIKYALDHKLV